MKINLQVVSLFTFLLAFGSANANELLVTSASAKSKSSNAFALDVSSDGNATALQIRLDVGEGLKVDLSKCVSALPSSHTGACSYKNGRVTVLVHSDRNELLPAGIVSIGSISTTGRSSKAWKISELLAFDRSGNEISISSILNRGSSDSIIAK